MSEMYDETLLQQRLAAFNPEPLIKNDNESDEIIEIPMVKEDENIIDLAKTNYLDVLNNAEIKQVSEEIIRQYGVGTCGPRAFYGTTDVHLEMEERLAQFLHMEESIVYSYGFVAISSSIAAYCKKNDVVFVDENTNFPIEQGLITAKSKIVKFNHNDPESFREEVAKISGKARKFLIIEGISWKTGKLCPLLDFLDIAEEFKIRVFLEESYSVGVFGDTGRGLTEYFNVDSSRIDMIFGTLEGAIGSIGGFCAGSKLIIEHQRLSGTGYIFSASLPTFLVKVVLKSLEIMGENPKKFAQLAKKFHTFLESCGFEVESHPEAPFKLFRATDNAQVHTFCKENGVYLIKNNEGLIANINVQLADDKERLEKAFSVLKQASQLVTK